MFFLACATLFTGCDTDERKDLETVLEGRRLNIERTEERLEKETEKLDEAVGELEAAKQKAAPALESEENHERMVLEIAQYKESLQGIERKIRENEAIIDQYREQFQPSLPELGTSLGDLRLNDGRVLSKAVFTEIVGYNISIRHQGGFTNVAVRELPDSLAANFVLPPNEAGNVNVRFGEILNSKPSNLRTEEDSLYLVEYSDQLDQLAREKIDQERREEERMRRELADQARAEEQQQEQQQERMRRELAAQRAEIQAKIDALRLRIGKLETEKYQKLSEMNSSNIRRSQSDIDKVTRAYDEAIAPARTQMSVHEAELRRIK
jgi:DNA repair exonuclease SbcCD ATPase subunit